MILLLPPLPSISLTTTEKERQLADGRGGVGGETRSNDGEKAWFSITHSILSEI
jgi:hypothetical protein